MFSSSNQECLKKLVMPAILARMWLSLTKIVMVPIIAIARSAFWIVGGLSKLSFGQTKIPDDVAFAMKLYHCPSTQKILTEFLIKIVEPAIVKKQRESIPKEEMLRQRLIGEPLPSPIIVQPRRLKAQRRDDAYIWN